METTPIVTIVIIMALILFSIFLRAPLRKKEKERTAEFAQIASDLQMSFSNTVDRSFKNRLKPFKRFRLGLHNSFKNMLHEDKNSVQFAFFECFKKIDQETPIHLVET